MMVVLVTKKARLLLLSVLGVAVFSLLGLSWGRPDSNLLSLAGKVIVVDPGHGGMDSGTSHQNIVEKNVTLLLGHQLAKALQDKGAYVILTRSTDADLCDQITPEQEIELTKEEYYDDVKQGYSTDSLDRRIALGTRYPPRYRLGLRARLEITRKEQADIFVSIHTNRYRASYPQGSLTLHQAFSEDSKRLAQAIQSYLGPLLPGRSVPDYVPDDFFVLRTSEVPAVIVEVGFLTNPRDREMMLSPEGRGQIVQAIACGIEEYFTVSTNPPVEASSVYWGSKW